MSELWIWTVRDVGAGAEPGGERVDVTGFEVESRDGHKLGKVDEATYETPGSFLVVDTGFWIFGKRRMLPAGVVTDIDPEARTLTVSVDQNAVKGAPDHDDARRDDQAYRDHVGGYFERSQYAGMEGDPLAPTPGTEHR